MSQELKRAGKNLLFKLSPKQDGTYFNFKPTNSDFKDLKTILEYVNRVESKTIYNNQIAAKLYIMELVGQIREKGTTIFNDSVFERISNQLSKPLDVFYQAFYEDLCSNQLNKLTEGTFTDKEGNNIIMDYKRFKETFPLEYVISKIDERFNVTLHKRS